MIDDNDPLHKQVLAARRAIKWSQQQLGDHIGVAQPSIHRIENGGNCSTLAKRALADFVKSVKSGELRATPAPAAAAAQ